MRLFGRCKPPVRAFCTGHIVCHTLLPSSSSLQLLVSPCGWTVPVRWPGTGVAHIPSFLSLPTKVLYKYVLKILYLQVHVRGAMDSVVTGHRCVYVSDNKIAFNPRKTGVCEYFERPGGGV